MTTPEFCARCGTERFSMRDKYCRKCAFQWTAVDANAPNPSAGRMKTSTKVVAGIVAGIGLIIVISAVAGSGGSNDGSTASAAPTAAKAAPPPQTPTYKLAVTILSCNTDSTGTRECKGSVKNLQPDKNVTDASPIVHWAGGTDSDFGEVDINPILPGQTSTFTVYTLHANPQLVSYSIGFKKVFGEESEYPVAPTKLP